MPSTSKAAIEAMHLGNTRQLENLASVPQNTPEGVNLDCYVSLELLSEEEINGMVECESVSSEQISTPSRVSKKKSSKKRNGTCFSHPNAPNFVVR